MASILKSAKLLEVSYRNGDIRYYNPQNKEDFSKINTNGVKNIRVFFKTNDKIDFTEAFAGCNFSSGICVDLSKLIMNTKSGYSHPTINFYSAFAGATFDTNKNAILCDDKLRIGDYKLGFKKSVDDYWYFTQDCFDREINNFPSFNSIFGNRANNNYAKFDHNTFGDYDLRNSIFNKLIEGQDITVKNDIPKNSLFFTQLIVGFANYTDGQICHGSDQSVNLSTLYGDLWAKLLKDSKHNQVRVDFLNTNNDYTYYINNYKCHELIEIIFKMFGCNNSWIKDINLTILSEKQRDKRKYYLDEFDKILYKENGLSSRLQNIFTQNPTISINLEQFTTVEDINNWTYDQRQKIINDIESLIKSNYDTYIDDKTDKYLYDGELYHNIYQYDDKTYYQIYDVKNNKELSSKIQQIIENYKRAIELCYSNFEQNVEKIKNSNGNNIEFTKDLIVKLNTYSNGKYDDGKTISKSMNLDIEIGPIIFLNDKITIDGFDYKGLADLLNNDFVSGQIPEEYIDAKFLFNYINNIFVVDRIIQYSDNHYLDDNFYTKIQEILIDRTSQFYDEHFKNIQDYWKSINYETSNLIQISDNLQEILNGLTDINYNLNKISLLFDGNNFRKYNIKSSTDKWNFTFDVGSYGNGKNLIITERKKIIEEIYNIDIKAIKARNNEIEQLINKTQWDDSSNVLDIQVTNTIVCHNYNGDELGGLLKNITVINCFDGDLPGIIKDLKPICIQKVKDKFEQSINTNFFIKDGSLLTPEELQDMYIGASDEDADSILKEANNIITLFEELKLNVVYDFDVKQCYNESDIYYQLYNLLKSFITSENESIASTIEIETE